MKRLALSFVFVLAGLAGSAHADIFSCMDCTERSVKDANGGHVEASCCLSVGGHCYAGDVLKDVDVGSGCRVSAPDPDGFTICDSDRTFDPNCGGGGNKTSEAGFQGDQGCLYDNYGYCDVSCSSCTWG